MPQPWFRARESARTDTRRTGRAAFTFVSIGEREFESAADAYAYARAHAVPLLFEGGDFSLTDIAPA